MIDIPRAVSTGVVSVERLVPFMTEKMRARYTSLPFKAKSAVIAAFPYLSAAPSGGGNIARYARAADYQETIFRFLSGAAEGKDGFHAVKNGWPLPLVPAAGMSGVGFTGRHGLQIVAPYGSYVALGAVICETELEETAPSGGCLGCGACESACPTGAMRFDGSRRVLNRERCISSITQSKDGARLELLGGSRYIWGCDLCQEACPHNADAEQTGIPEFRRDIIADIDAGAAVPPGRHYSEGLLRRNLRYSAAATSSADATTIASVSQTFDITPV